MSGAPITHALILAAGRGERMRPLTDAVPKPLLRAGGKRLIEWQIESLVRAGVLEIVVNVAHLPDQFEAVLGDGRSYGAALRYSREGNNADDALESLGGIVKALPWLGDAPFIVTSGDIVTDFPYQRLQGPSEAQQLGDTDAHLVLVENPPFHLRGDMALIDERIDPDAIPRMTYANIGVFSPRVFADVASTLQNGRAPLFPWLYKSARARRVSGELYRGRWWNAGTPEDLSRLDADLSRSSAVGARETCR
ncbi:MAG TPA: nucleotidyltransferase family protein [Burkholderiaceae bacterium]|nr:nucleotidyltransferase family protein [Burkholderiaceae bacterium]